MGTFDNPETALCEFCGELTPVNLGGCNEFHGFYCEGCIKLEIGSEQELLKKIKETKRKK